MKIKLTKEQMYQLLNDQYIDVSYEDNDMLFMMYQEIDRDLGLEYIEVSSKMDGQRRQGYAFKSEDLQRLIPKKPYDPSYYHNYPLCPKCQTYMIYKFENCPKCGQHLDWSGFVE